VWEERVGRVRVSVVRVGGKSWAEMCPNCKSCWVIKIGGLVVRCLSRSVLDSKQDCEKLRYQLVCTRVLGFVGLFVLLR
jgi:hypothetical protein